MSQPPPRQLIIVRHAHRDKPEGGTLDNGLSKKGISQALKIARFASRQFEPALLEKAILLSSPKKRCRETLEPLAKDVNLAIDTLKVLDEKGSSKSQASYEKAIRDYFISWKNKKNPLTFICSHGDWIPLALQILMESPVDLKKGGWIQLTHQDDTFRLTWILQRLGR